MYILFKNIRFKVLIKILLIITTSLLLDLIWTNIYDLVPAWDQGFHLSNSYKYHYLIKDINILSEEWWHSFWSVTDNYRGPLTYIISGFFTNITGITLKNALLSNTIFNIITIFSIYKICDRFFKKEIGLWASFLYSFNPYIFSLRNDYLIDLSQLSFICLSTFFLSEYYLSKRNNYFYLTLSGFILGLLFLVKPTGIFYLILPSILIIQKIISDINNNFIKKSINILIYFFSFLITIFPWVSINWLTLITSTINAWNWGLKYQEGLEINSIQGWLYYPIEIWKISNPLVFITCIFSLLIYVVKFKKINLNFFLSKGVNFKKYIWFSSIPLNILILNIGMTTKDTRFIIPLLPVLNIVLGYLISSLNNKYNYSRIVKFLISILIILSLIINQLKIYNISFQNLSNKIPSPNIIHNQIIQEVHNLSPNIASTIGFLPDTKNFNAFNLDAEAVRQNNGIRVMQIVSNVDSYKEDINNYDWFILKTGSQGVMTNKAKNKLNNLLLNSNDFSKYKEWTLQDNSKIILLKKNLLSEEIEIKDCKKIKKNSLNLIKIKNGFKIQVKGNANDLDNSSLFIDLKNGSDIKKLNYSIPSILNIKKENVCMNFNGIYNSDIYKNSFLSNSKIYSYIVKNNNTKKINIENSGSLSFELDQTSLKTNKIEKVSLMGEYLRSGDFEKLSKIVGLINQSDPEQNYLKDAEIIFRNRLLLKNNDINDLYSLSISQILQKKAREAKNTINKIIKEDKLNANPYFAKSIVEIYMFDFKNALHSIEKSILLNKKKEIEETLKTIYLITKILNFKLI